MTELFGDWQQVAVRLGVPVDTVVQQDTLIFAAIAIFVAWVAGWAVQRYVGPRLRAFLNQRDATAFHHIATHAPRLLGVGTVVTILVAAKAVQAFGFYGAVLIAIALGLAVGRLAYVISRLLRINTILALLFGLLAGLASIASSLGGLEPLITALDDAALRIGTRRVSILDVLNAVVVVVVLYTLSRFAAQLLSRQIGSSSRLDLSQRVLFQKISGIAVVAVAFFLGIELLGIDLTALAVFSGAFGLAIGFGMQKTFGNLLSGLILLVDRSIKPGDVIVVDDTFGWVNKIGVRAVSIITRDGIEYLIPNEILMTEQVENWSYSSRNVRIHVPVGVSYNCDIHKAQELMLQAAKETKRVLADPPPNVWLKGYGDSSVDHDILCWINDAEEGVGNVRSAILNRLWDLFKEHGIEIPFPQRDVHLKTVPGALFDAEGGRKDIS
ncbi:mechanosensitive ion channel protein MscS [Pacificimonas flava]|uniref:Mechanosensitive ion channel protein MscS n=2 Tax=Pacificimonas TaxID=1960290 RepID=A0A219B782_9SPHN|nr:MULTISPECIES: mechanosensitive ion channel domain-containing protein [Pacificimonas]MBZ6379132.1 mechanosensitive ion channel [Pacificimonas aurantium]OWV33638.1 mechanosensitive ion channel protein MscS [Pacificimonas flava]